MCLAYRALLRLYPHDFRVWFTAEMTTAFEIRAGECRARGWADFLRFAFAELIGLLKGAAVERAARIAADPAVRARAVPDLRMMRPPGIPREAYFARVCVNVWRNRG